MVIKKKFNINNLVLLAIIMPLAVLIILSSSSVIYSINFVSTNEVISNLSSFFIVSLIWMIFYIKLNGVINNRILNIVTCLFFTKTIINFLYIYHFQLPLFGYDSSNAYEISKAGDSGLTHVSVIKAIYLAPDLYDRFFSYWNNYYNNTGVLIFYSLIYESFGRFPTNTIPWDSLVVGIYSIVFYLISGFINNDEKSILVPITIFILPAFFLTPLLYRDVYIVLFLSISIFIIFDKENNNNFQKFLILIFVGFILFFFRKFYSILPLAFFIIYLIVKNIKLRKIILTIFIILTAILSAYIFVNFELIFTDSVHTGLQKSEITLNPLLSIIQDAQLKIIHGERSGGEFVTLLENQNYFLKIFLRFFFFLISPFPWFKNEFDSNTIYYLLVSLQIFFSLIFYFHVINLIISKRLDKNFFILIVYFLLICFLAILGALQFTHYYIMSGIPILALTLTKIKLKHFKKYFIYSLSLGLLLHVTHFISKKFLF